METTLEISLLKQIIAQFEAENAALKIQVAQLIAKVAQLEKVISDGQVKKNSKNSSLPPSKEIVKPNQSLRTKSNRKRGGQMGHKGHSLKMSDTPDKIVFLEPHYCNECGADIEHLPSQLDSRRQVIEIPPINPIYIEYQSMSKLCSCGHKQVADFPSNITNHIQYGASVQAVVAYESVRQYTPFQRLSEKMECEFNLPISAGTIRNMVHNMAQKGEPIYNGIQRRVRLLVAMNRDSGYQVKTGGHLCQRTSIVYGSLVTRPELPD